MFKYSKHYKHGPRNRQFRFRSLLTAIIAVILIVVIILCIRDYFKSSRETKIGAEQIISNFDGVNIYTLNLDQIVNVGTSAIPALEKMLKNESQEIRWAALMGLSAIGHQIDAKSEVLSLLKKSLNDSDISIRITAAELVLSFGDKNGIPILIEAFDSEEQMHPSEPPMPVKSQAVMILIEYTNQDFQADKEAWQNWWNENSEILNWSEENGKFE